jgi:hypothetical protein
MSRDKKVRNGAMRWILPTSIGQSGIYDGVPLGQARQAIESVAQRQASQPGQPESEPIGSVPGIHSREQSSASAQSERPG